MNKNMKYWFARVDDEDKSASKVCFLSISLHFVSVYVYWLCEIELMLVLILINLLEVEGYEEQIKRAWTRS